MKTETRSIVKIVETFTRKYMIPESTYSRVAQNKNIAIKDRNAIIKLFGVSDDITFGKIGPRQEGYIYTGVGYPRCTSVLQMDGSKAMALMEWAKREVAHNINQNLVYKLHHGDPITEWVIDEACKEGYENPDKQKEDAADEGTYHHDNIENWLNGLEFEMNERLQRFQRIWKAENVELVCTELPLVYRGKDGHGFGGKLDILAYKKGEFIIYDNKTSRSVHNSYGIQTAAYKEAVEQMSKGDIKISKCKIIHIPELANLKEWQLKQYKKLGELVECKNPESAFKHFNLLLEQYYMRNNKYIGA